MTANTSVILIASLIAPALPLHAVNSLPASVTIHADNPGAKIPADFLGFSCEKKILSRDCFEADNQVLIALFRNLGSDFRQQLALVTSHIYPLSAKMGSL